MSIESTGMRAAVQRAMRSSLVNVFHLRAKSFIEAWLMIGQYLPLLLLC